jgi:hypothetical protein
LDEQIPLYIRAGRYEFTDNAQKWLQTGKTVLH